jgi:hypothetical protein
MFDQKTDDLARAQTRLGTERCVKLTEMIGASSRPRVDVVAAWLLKKNAPIATPQGGRPYIVRSVGTNVDRFS